MQTLLNILNQYLLFAEEAKVLNWVFHQRDEMGEGNLRMDDIREQFAYHYCASLISREDIDTMLSKCTVQVSKRGMIKYYQFIQVM